MDNKPISIKDQCKEVFLTINNLLNDKKIEEVANYMASFISNDNYDVITQVNLLKSILVITKDYPNESIQEIRSKVKSVYNEKLSKIMSK